MASVNSASDLYGLPLDQFTSERNELAKRLKADGEKDEAARVAKLRKPSTAAWAVNQLVRTQKKAFAALIEAGDEMINAQAKAVSGKGSVEALRSATQHQREATQWLLDRVGGLLSSDGHELPASVHERVSETLRAAAVDPDSREQVQTGCLTRELQFTGIAGFGQDVLAPSRSGEKGEQKKDQKQRERREQEAEKKRKRKAELKAGQDRAREARADLKRAEKELAQAQKALKSAQEEVKKLQRGGK